MDNQVRKEIKSYIIQSSLRKTKETQTINNKKDQIKIIPINLSCLDMENMPQLNSENK